MALRTTVGEKRRAMGWSVAELARRSGVSKEMIYKVEAGDREPGAGFIEGMLRAFPNLTYRDLFMPEIGPPGSNDGTIVHSPPDKVLVPVEVAA